MVELPLEKSLSHYSLPILKLSNIKDITPLSYHRGFYYTLELMYLQNEKLSFREIKDNTDIIGIFYKTSKSYETLKNLSDIQYFSNTISFSLPGGCESMYKNFQNIKTGMFMRFKSGKMQYANKLLDYGMDTAFRKFKNQIGTEFYIMEKMFFDGKKTREYMKCVFPQLYTKYSNSSTRDIMPFADIKVISPGTFMFVASQRFIPGSIEEAFTGNSSTRGMLYIYIFGKQYKKFARMLRQSIKHDDIENSTNSIYTVSAINSDRHDITAMNFSSRHLDTLVFSNNENEIIKNHLDKFAKNVDFYKSKGITYKTGILLYGTPGTGKTSLARAIATMYHRNICQINMATIESIDLSSLSVMIDQDKDKFIVLFEDIDTLYLDRESNKADKDYNAIINKLLQFLDSNTSPNDVIFIATTNHVDRLDEALLRPGRFDLKLEVKGLDKKDVHKLVNILDPEGSVENVLNSYGSCEKDGTYNQSKIQNIVVRGKAIRDGDEGNISIDERNS